MTSLFSRGLARASGRALLHARGQRTWPASYKYKSNSTMKVIYALVPGLVLFLCIRSCVCQIYVTGSGHDSSRCLLGHEAFPCRTLNYAFQHGVNASGSGSVEYILFQEVYQLNESFSFREMSNFTMLCNGGGKARIECTFPGPQQAPHGTPHRTHHKAPPHEYEHREAGVAFVNVSSVHLESIDFVGCATVQNSTSMNYSLAASSHPKLSTVAVGVYFSLCRDVTLLDISVVKSSNATGVVMYNTAGTVTVVNGVFSNNSNGILPGGGGFYVEFSYCSPGDNGCFESTSPEAGNNITGSKYMFYNCSFNWNKASASDGASSDVSFILPYQYNHVAFGRGGGLSVFFNGNAANNTVNVLNCNFVGNTALWGGGLFSECHDRAAGNRVYVYEAVVADNRCPYDSLQGTGGGGMRVGHYVYREAAAGNGNSVALESCRFFNNSALDGGGLSISSTLQDTHANQVGSVSVQNCSFIRNYARLGLAVHVALFPYLIDGLGFHVVISNSLFERNFQRLTSSSYQTGAGAVYINGIRVKFIDSILFLSNCQSALSVVDTWVDFGDCRSEFYNNSGLNGGAISLLGGAAIILNNNTSFNFTNNHAVYSGGAIYNLYIQKEDLFVYPNCFLHHEDYFILPQNWTAKFTFRNNSAVLSGSAIYTTSVYSCARAGGSGVSNLNEVFCWNHNWDYDDKNCSKYIYSDVGSIKIPNHTITATPGRTFNLQLEMFDDYNHSITDQTVLTAYTPNSDVAKVSSGYEYVADGVISLMGGENLLIDLQLNTVGTRTWHVSVEVELQNCPPGSYLNEGVCDCPHVNATFASNIQCTGNQSDLVTQLRNGYWIGYCCNDMLVVALCYHGFCEHKSKVEFLPLPQKLDNDSLCREFRTGIMCGECIDEHGPAVNSEKYDCVPCSNRNLAANISKYIFCVYFPLFVFFMAIILFDIRLTSAPANAFILFSQLINGDFDLMADGEIPLDGYKYKFLQVLYFPYRIFNLDFFVDYLDPFCFSSSMTTLDVIELEYLVAFFPLMMIMFVLLFLKLREKVFHRCCSNRQGYNWRWLNWLCNRDLSLTHSFAAFMLLSYNRLCLTSTRLVNSNPLYDKYWNEVHPQRSYYYGELSVSDTRYLQYYIPAYLVFATFIALPPIVLLGFPVIIFEKLIMRFSCLRRLYPADKIHILMDTFQGCFKDNMRYFASAYFIFRLLISVIYIEISTWLAHFVIQQIVCILFLIFIAIFQPYKQPWSFVNYVDIIVFATFTVMNTLSIYLLFLASVPGYTPSDTIFYLQSFIGLLPLVYMVSYLLWCYLSPHWSVFKTYFCCCLTKTRMPQSRIDHSLLNAEMENEAYRQLLGRAEEENTYQPPDKATVQEPNYGSLNFDNDNVRAATL